MNSDQTIRDRYDEVSPRYDGDEPADPRVRLYWLAYEHLTFRAVEALLPPPGTVFRILDAGGGGGKYGVMMAERGHRVTVLDISPGMLEKARALFAEKGLLDQASFVVGSVADLPLADASFDLVFCEGDPVSYCLDEYPRAIAELTRVVVPGGPVILGVDNRFDYFTGLLRGPRKAEALSVLLDGRSTCPYGLPVHTFTLAELDAAVKAAGAEVVEIFGKPVLFWELLAALEAARGPGFDAWESRAEILALQERMAHEGYAATGGHLQVMARRRMAPHEGA
jgi:ubiquinone/menaquinone biosynthesis C-methylase UbiE